MFMSAEVERLLIVISVLLLSGTAVFVTVARRGGPRRGIVGTALPLIVLILASAIAARWIREQQGPFLTMYDILLSNLFSLTLIYGLIYRLGFEFRRSAAVVVPFLALLGFWLLATEPKAEPLPPTFDNPWLWLHVLSGKIFFAFCMTAAAVSITLNRHAIGDDLSTQTGVSHQGDKAVWQLLSLAFIAHSAMLVAGAAWAHDAWGRYWAWDSLETSSLLTWLCLGLLLHVRATLRRLPATYLRAGNVFVFILAFVTFLGIPFLSIAPHKGVL